MTSRFHNEMEARMTSEDDDNISASGNLKFPFFDMEDQANTSRSYIVEKQSLTGDSLLSPSPSIKRSQNSIEATSSIAETKWESEISPIAKTTDSDCSGEILDISSSSYPIGQELIQTSDEDPGEDIDGMLSELKDIIQDSRQQRKFRSRISSIEASSIQSESEFQVEKLTAQPTPPPKSQALQEAKESESKAQTIEPFDDLSDVVKQVDQSSNHFIESIRDAAHRRKVAMTKSRDSLKAKEREQLEANAAFKQGDMEGSDDDLEYDGGDDIPSFQERKESASGYRFKARPLPATTGIKGMGGLSGVPKVAKRPTTTPLSPLLGARRSQKSIVNVLEKPKMRGDKENDRNAMTFKARPVPSFIGRKGQGGLSGVPKVIKRMVTIPKSPMLGTRRQMKSLEEKPRNSGSNQCYAQSPANSLLGLGLLHATPDQKNLSTEDKIRIHDNVQPTTYELHSTSRAKKRAEYDARRDVNNKRRMAMDTEIREMEIRKMQKELRIMSRSLS